MPKKGKVHKPSETQYDRGEFGDDTTLSKDFRPVPKVIGDVAKQRREICWALALARLLQAIYNLNLKDISQFLEFMHEDLVKHLMPKAMARKVANLELNNLKNAIAHISTKGLLTVKSSGRNKAGGSGNHKTWDFDLKENATAEFIKQKLDISPVAISFLVSVPDDEFFTMGKGIYKVKTVMPDAGKRVASHMVLVVGYGYTKDGKLFFLIQNSWGTDWGVKGYARIFIDDNSGATMIYPIV